MAQRKRIALIFKVDKEWMGGTYYVLNLISALNTLQDEEKPLILLLCKNNEDFILAKNFTNYPYLEYRDTFKSSKRQLIARIINKLGQIFRNENLMCYHYFSEKVDAIYPVMNRFDLKSRSKKFYWIPDFQEHYLPQYFSPEIIKHRDIAVKGIIREGGQIVFSSCDALDSFKRFYPEGNNVRTSIFHFASTMPQHIDDAKKIIEEKYKISSKFFFCANQFWAHKNHKVLFEAIRILKNKGIDILVLCSGGTEDYRNPDYFPSLLKFIKDNELQKNIKILGFIDRKDQLALMQECAAIIQPSLFEGWSTSVEEAKALNKFMIVSDLNVHKEQVSHNVLFFDRYSEEDLADKMKLVMNGEIKSENFDYSISIKKSAESFIAILQECSESFRDSSMGKY